LGYNKSSKQGNNMNERIDQLLWAAGGFTKLNYPDDAFLDGRYALTQEQLDKFAELIVRECAAVAYSYDPLEEAPSAIAILIQTHFGAD